MTENRDYIYRVRQEKKLEEVTHSPIHITLVLIPLAILVTGIMLSALFLAGSF